MRSFYWHGNHNSSVCGCTTFHHTNSPSGGDISAHKVIKTVYILWYKFCIRWNVLRSLFLSLYFFIRSDYSKFWRPIFYNSIAYIISNKWVLLPLLAAATPNATPIASHFFVVFYFSWYMLTLYPQLPHYILSRLTNTYECLWNVICSSLMWDTFREFLWQVVCVGWNFKVQFCVTPNTIKNLYI